VSNKPRGCRPCSSSSCLSPLLCLLSLLAQVNLLSLRHLISLLPFLLGMSHLFSNLLSLFHRWQHVFFLNFSSPNVASYITTLLWQLSLLSWLQLSRWQIADHRPNHRIMILRRNVKLQHKWSILYAKRHHGGSKNCTTLHLLISAYCTYVRVCVWWQQHFLHCGKMPLHKSCLTNICIQLEILGSCYPRSVIYFSKYESKVTFQ
jgi:hypothetical protein